MPVASPSGWKVTRTETCAENSLGWLASPGDPQVRQGGTPRRAWRGRGGVPQAACSGRVREGQWSDHREDREFLGEKRGSDLDPLLLKKIVVKYMQYKVCYFNHF